MDSNEPIEQRQFGSVHHSTACKGGSATAARALPLISITFPIMVGAATFRAYYGIAFTQCLQMSLASLLIGEMSLEFYEIHSVAILF